MIINSNLGGTGRVPEPLAGHLRIASLDVEWTKNYTIKNGNVPFCWSITWLQLPQADEPALVPTQFSYTSAYVTGTEETQDLIDAAEAEIGVVYEHADLIIGHQVSSDLGVLRNASRRALPQVEKFREGWHGRRGGGSPSIVDSRYDVGDVLEGTSRRLVDVCTELRLDVTQPELARKSMTALHKIWLVKEDPEARERITVLNLRHGLSAAYVALRGTNLGRWDGTLNVNTALHTQLGGTYAWLDTPTFHDLL